MNTPLRMQFMRTVCDCPVCRKNCQRQPGPLAPEDIGLICDTLEIHPTELEPMLRASPGALVVYRGKVMRIGTITPARKSDGTCVFLADDGRCAIHECAPFGCSHFDEHMTYEKADQRSQALHWEIMHSAEYQKLRAKLETESQSGNDRTNDANEMMPTGRKGKL